MRLSILAVAALVAAAPAAAQSRTDHPVDMSSARKDLRNLLVAQEVYFTDNNRYSPTLGSLAKFAPSDSVEVKIIEASANAYSASATIKGRTGVSCVFSVGHVAALPKTAGGLQAKAEGQVVCDGD